MRSWKAIQLVNVAYVDGLSIVTVVRSVRSPWTVPMPVAYELDHLASFCKSYEILRLTYIPTNEFKHEA